MPAKNAAHVARGPVRLSAGTSPTQIGREAAATRRPSRSGCMGTHAVVTTTRPSRRPRHALDDQKKATDIVWLAPPQVAWLMPPQLVLPMQGRTM